MKNVAGASDGDMLRFPVGRPFNPIMEDRSGIRWPRAPYWRGGFASAKLKVVVFDEPGMLARDSSAAASRAVGDGGNARANRIWITRNVGRVLRLESPE